MMNKTEMTNLLFSSLYKYYESQIEFHKMALTKYLSLDDSSETYQKFEDALVLTSKLNEAEQCLASLIKNFADKEESTEQTLLKS